jgi:hypothetical protein
VETEKLRKDIATADYGRSTDLKEPSAAIAGAAPVIRGAEGSVPATARITGAADISGDTFSGEAPENPSS